jgi:hypothetical protein
MPRDRQSAVAVLTDAVSRSLLVHLDSDAGLTLAPRMPNRSSPATGRSCYRARQPGRITIPPTSIAAFAQRR